MAAPFLLLRALSHARTLFARVSLRQLQIQAAIPPASPSKKHPFDELFERIKAASMATDTNTDGTATKAHSVLDSTFPVFLPSDTALFLSETTFQQLVQSLLEKSPEAAAEQLKDEIKSNESEKAPEPKSAFMEGLRTHEAHLRTSEELWGDNKTLTENADVTNVSAKNPLVDLFYDLGESTAADNLRSLLENAWKEDSLMTLKIIFNARSIHLGKSNKITAYKAFGWLAETHPLTFLTSLPWLVRPIIEKKKPTKKKEKEEPKEVELAVKSEDEDFDMVEAEDNESVVGMGEPDSTKAHDVRFGVSHGYWKDLLNLVVFAANDELKFNGNPSSLLNQKQDNSSNGKRTREWDTVKAKELRKQKERERHQRVVQRLENDSFYRALHMTVARLFAAQLKDDSALLNSGKKSDLKKLSLAAKWAPTFSEFHDKHTFILSSIAEILFPRPEEICPDAGNRELYLRHARESYRKTIASPLRKALSVVEREIAANNYDDIKYERVPSLAMDRYTPLFIRKDYEHFFEYINKVAGGKAKISGATLLPSTLVSKARAVDSVQDISTVRSLAAVKASAVADISRKVLDGQWKTLVQRIRDSGTLESSIAVCDVSSSMSWEYFKDGSCPMDSSIGLSLLLAEVTAPPFGGSFITFSESPTVVSVGGEKDARGFVDKVKYIQQAQWGSNTDFVKVFEDLILPMATHNYLKPEDMVKQVFVFSDMQFDVALSSADRWTSSFERIKQNYAAAGYEMPRLIFWNLAASSTDKPTTMDDVNTALVSGYSQGMMKTFLDGAGFEDTEEEEVVEEAVKGEEGMTEVMVKKKMDPMTIVRKAVSHQAYSMLEVVD